MPDHTTKIEPVTGPDRPLEPRRRAIVIGASSGIGAALARELARQGYLVAALARRETLLNDLVAALNANSEDRPRAFAYAHNVTDYQAVPELFERIVRELGGLDLVIYAAGLLRSAPADGYPFEQEAAMIDVNLKGAMAWLGQAAVRFQRAGSGHIVGISSIAGDRGRRANPAYNASKAGFSTYLEALRNRLAPHGVTVTTIKPGFVDTEMLRHAPRTMWVISADEAARQMVQAIHQKKQSVYVPARWRLVMLIIRNIPSFLFRRLNI